MFKRPHHQKIAALLGAMNADFLRESKCFFGGGTAIAMLLGEYRDESGPGIPAEDLAAELNDCYAEPEPAAERASKRPA